MPHTIRRAPRARIRSTRDRSTTPGTTRVAYSARRLPDDDDAEFREFYDQYDLASDDDGRGYDDGGPDDDDGQDDDGPDDGPDDTDEG